MTGMDRHSLSTAEGTRAWTAIAAQSMPAYCTINVRLMLRVRPALLPVTTML
jgi:hypothetical protein